MKKLFILVNFLLLISFNIFSQTGITKEDYLKIIQETEEKLWKEYEDAIQIWQKSREIKNIAKPKLDYYFARKAALLYQVTGELKYAERVKEYLLGMEPADNYYIIKILNQIKPANILTSADLKEIEKKIVDGTKYAMNFWEEWGAMNHCSNHIINSLTATINYLPDHTDVPKWKQKRDINLSGNWGLWSTEDSQNYIPVWLKPMIQYAELAGREKEFFDLPTTKYYFDYLVQLLTPEGQIAEFGDGASGANYEWDWVTSILEKGASVYKDGKMKWAAHRIFESSVYEKNLGGYGDEELIEAYLWADDSIKEEIPKDRSRLVLEDYVGKKIVFRDGWNKNSTYLFLNYLDEPSFGLDGKEQMLYTINAEAEKNHHGHADENSINLLMKNGSYLLHDGGYRETESTGPNGEFRADVFHNRLIVRNKISDPNDRLLPNLFDIGRYHSVNTKLIFFRNFNSADVSRTRLSDQKRGYDWDRVITFLKDLSIFVIFDIVKITKSGPFTLSNLLYTQNIASFDKANDEWYDTYYRTICEKSRYTFFEPNKGNERLLIYFPDSKNLRKGAEQIRRSYQTERAVYSSLTDTLKEGDIKIFCTLLIPHEADKNIDSITSKFIKYEIFKKGNGYGIKIPFESGYIQINAMVDLSKEILSDNIRPRYNFNSGKAEYGEFITDACYSIFRKENNLLNYSFFKASKIIYKNDTIFESNGSFGFGQDNGPYRKYGVTKRIAWEDKIVLKK